MNECIEDILHQARPKIKGLLRIRTIYDVPELFNQHETHIWSRTEYRNGTILHAAPSQLARIDSMQRGFLKELHVSEIDAFSKFNFALSVLRRDIDILGLLHKRILGLAHPRFEELFPFVEITDSSHNKQIEIHLNEITCRSSLFFR